MTFAVLRTSYAVDPELAGETVLLWWGLFDQDLYVEHHERRYGPYHPVTGPIPLHRYRRMKKTTREKRTERIEALAYQLTLPRSALDGVNPVELPDDLLAAPRTLINCLDSSSERGDTTGGSMLL